MPANHPLLDYLNPIWRQRFLVACVASVGALTTLWMVYSLPNMYRSTTLIMVEPQGVPETFVKATVRTQIEQRLNALSQEVLSRTRLDAIIEDLDLFRDLRRQNVAREQVVDAMRRHIQVEVLARDSAFRISYEGGEPAMTQQVTGRLAGLYIDENLKIREQQVSGTAEFLESELEKVKQELESQEGLIQGFKQKHMGELPEQRDANLQTLEGLRVQLQTVSLALSSAQERKILLERQGREALSILAEPARGGAAGAGGRTQLEQLHAELDALLGRYTEQHPDVLQLRKRVAEAERARLDASDGGELTRVARLPPELSQALAETDLEIVRLKVQKQNLEKSADVYQARIEAAFSREQQLLVLMRDYDVTRKQYQTLLDKKLEAQLSQSLERRQKGERFRVLDPPSLPQRPTRPNRGALLLAGLAASLGLALGLPVLLWQLDTSLREPDEVAVALALPVLAVIPQVETPEVAQSARRWRIRVASLSLAGLILGLGTVTFYARFLF